VAVTRIVLVMLVVLASAGARAQGTETSPGASSPPPASDWTGRSAIVQPRAHGQVALFGESRIGVGHALQVGAHVAGLLALTPHAALLYRFLERRGLHAAARLGLAYPWPTLWLLTGKGAGALLPADTKPAQTLLWDLGARGSLELPRGQLVTLEAALVVAAKFTHTRSPLLDFPFLYPRFAALHTPVTARLSANAEGVIVAGFRWVGALDAWILPVVKHGFALEPRAGLAWSAQRRVTLELGGRGSYARYPVGLRFHSTPYFDVRVRF
jgi:hypothetical protein